MNRTKWVLLATILVLAALSAALALIVTSFSERETLPAQASVIPAVPSQTSAQPEKAPKRRPRVLPEEPLEWFPQWARTKSPELDALYALAERDLPAALADAELRYADARFQELQIVLAAHVLELDFSKAKAVCGLLSDNMSQIVLQHVVPLAFGRDRAGTTSVVLHQLSKRAQETAIRCIVETQLEDGYLHAAIQMQLHLPESYSRTEALYLIAAKISSADLAVGLRWIGELSSDSERKCAYSRIAENLFAARDADGLTQLLEATPPEEAVREGGTQSWGRSSIIRQIASLRQQSGNTNSLQALRTMLPANEKEFVDVAMLYADRAQPLQDRFARAAALTHPEPRAAGIRTVIGSEVSQNPQRAADFVLRVENETFTIALWELANSWNYADGASFANWVRSLPAGSRREKAIEVFVQINRGGRRAEKELAMEFADLAADPARREQLRRDVGKLSILSERERAAGKP